MLFGGKVIKTRLGQFNNGDRAFGFDKRKIATGLDRVSQVANFAQVIAPHPGIAIAGAAAKIASRHLSSNFEKM